MQKRLMAAITGPILFGATMLGTPALAQDKMLDLSTPAAVVTAMHTAGFKAELKKNDSGETYVSSAANGDEFTVDFYDCKDGKCTAIAFATWYKPEPIFTPALTNEWNRDNRFLKIYVDKEGRLREEADVTTIGLLSQENFADAVGWFQTLDAKLSKFLTEKRDAAKANK